MYGNFFFFQAEDGIRDVAVTGVQTCALPILPGLALQGSIKGYKSKPEIQRECREVGIRPVLWGSMPQSCHGTKRGFQTRSEERRVGKECRSRWSPYH